MKRKILITVLVLISAVTAIGLAACTGDDEFDITKTLSYDQYMYYFGATEDFEVSITGVNREELFISDGKVGELKDSVKLTLRPLKPALLNFEYTYVLTGESGTLQGSLEKDSFGVSSSASLTDIASIGAIRSVTVTYGENVKEVALENAVTEIDNKKALEIAANAFKAEIDAALAEGEFGRETYVKLVRNDHDPNGGYYWFVSFIKDRDDYWAALIDSKTGEVVSTRKSVAEEGETSDTIAV